jgi:hypothetical protein
MTARNQTSLRIRIGAIHDEDGAILPIVALLIIILLGFAAIAVDLGAAWGQRTLNQSAADAGVMGGGIGFIGDPPQTNEEIVADVESYVDQNLGYQISAASGALGGGEWATCVDPKVTAGEFYPLIDGEGSVINPCVSLSAELSETGERIFRVLLPTQQMDTLFGGILGFDQIATGAFAEADLHFSTGGGGSLPFVMPADADEHYCIGDMPPGLAQSPCDGSNTGKSGDIISPWHGSEDYPGTDACPGSGTLNPLQSNIALGLDHQVRVAEGNDLDSDWSPADGQDDCDARDSGEFPYALQLGQGSESIQPGFAGLGPYGDVALVPGRLRQGGGLNGGILPDDDGHVSSVPLNGSNNTRAVSDKGGDIWLDNVGLWEYLLTDENAYGGNDGPCDGNNVEFTGDPTNADPYLQFPGGQKATAAMAACLASLPDLDTDDDPIDVFDDDKMLTSPRFALVPQLHVNGAQLNGMTPNTFTNIKAFIPVYIQATFWNCNSTDCEMRFRSFEDAKTDELAGVDNDPLNDLEFFSPGEGDEASCLVQTPGTCKSNPTAAMDGVTALVLNPKWVPQDIFTGGPVSDVPILIQLSG